MNSQRQLSIVSGTVSKKAEKLSSGYKINRAADDAAGLSISEKMRKQIRGLTKATENDQFGDVPVSPFILYFVCYLVSGYLRAL